jgi:hypothetical protein
MKRTIVVLSLVIAALIGCTAGVVLHESLVPSALAQAQAPDHQYKMCTGVTLAGLYQAKHLNEGKPLDQNGMVVIPDGWTPVGGTGTSTLIICK